MHFACIVGGLLSIVCLGGPQPAAPLCRPPMLGPIQMQVEESSLAARIRARLDEDLHHLSPGALESVHIEAERGFVLLQGTVPTMLDRCLIDSLTRSVQGVRAVNNQILLPDDVSPCRGGDPCTVPAILAALSTTGHRSSTRAVDVSRKDTGNPDVQ